MGQGFPWSLGGLNCTLNCCVLRNSNSGLVVLNEIDRSRNKSRSIENKIQAITPHIGLHRLVNVRNSFIITWLDEINLWSLEGKTNLQNTMQ
jgi:hypothetical protein